MANPKRHHYLPEFYLDRFTGSDRFLWVFDRSQGKLRREQPKNTAVIGHYYSFVDGSGNRNSAFEQILSLIEGRAKPVFDQLESGGHLTHSARYNLSLFLGYLFCRLPAFARSLNESINGLARIVLRKNLEDPETAKSFDFSEDFLNLVDSGELILGANDNMRIAQMVDQGKELGGKFFASSWVLAKAPDRTSFVTCDNPFGLIFPPEIPKALCAWSWGAFTPGVTRAFPLSSRTCLLMHGMTGSSFDRLTIDRDLVREINLATVSETESYAIAKDEVHLRSIARAADLYNPRPSTRMVMENHPDPTGDPTKSTLLVRRTRVGRHYNA